VHHVGILYGQFMMHGQRNIKFSFVLKYLSFLRNHTLPFHHSTEKKNHRFIVCFTFLCTFYPIYSATSFSAYLSV